MPKPAQKRQPLGRGLSALLGDTDKAYTTLGPDVSLREVAIIDLHPNPNQPRQQFDNFALSELSTSIKRKGILHPLVVREKDGKLEIIAGERRWRAAKLAGLTKLPVIIKKFTDKDTLEVGLIENIQREDLNPIEEARAYVELMSAFHHTQDQLSELVGKSRSHISNTIRLLKLPKEIHNMVQQGTLTAGHARTLLKSDNPIKDALAIVQEGMNVREAEDSFSHTFSKKRTYNEDHSHSATYNGPDLNQLADTFQTALGMRAAVHVNAKGPGGKVILYFKDANQLDDLIQKLAE